MGFFVFGTYLNAFSSESLPEGVHSPSLHKSLHNFLFFDPCLGTQILKVVFYHPDHTKNMLFFVFFNADLKSIFFHLLNQTLVWSKHNCPVKGAFRDIIFASQSFVQRTNGPWLCPAQHFQCHWWCNFDHTNITRLCFIFR